MTKETRPVSEQLAVESARILSERLNQITSGYLETQQRAQEALAASIDARKAQEQQYRAMAQMTQETFAAQQAQFQALAEQSRQNMKQAIEAITQPLRDITPIINPFGGFVESLAATLPKIEPIAIPLIEPLPRPDFTSMMADLALNWGTPFLESVTSTYSHDQLFAGLANLDEVVRATQRAFSVDMPTYSIADTLLSSLGASNAALLRETLGNFDDIELDQAVDYFGDARAFEELPSTLQEDYAEFKAFVFDNPIAFVTLLLFALSMLDFLQSRTLPTATDLLRDTLLLLLFLKEVSKEERK